MILEDFHGFSIFWSNQSQASLKIVILRMLEHLGIFLVNGQIEVVYYY